MSYNPITDFLALLRNIGGQATVEQMPGLDFVVSAMARAGLFTTYVGQTAPIVNQPTTVWVKPSLPSWVAECIVYLWDVGAQAYAPATPALWNALLVPPASVFQSVNGGSATIGGQTTLCAVQRVAPVATALILPTLASRSGKPLQLVDWSSSVTVDHLITITPAEVGVTIMRRALWSLYSTADQLGGITLFPSSDLNGWVIAP